MSDREERLHPIIDGVINYINMNNSGALLVTGNWGCGKTFYLKNTVIPYIKEILGKNIIIVSLFGLNNLNEIPERILYAYWDAVGKEKTGFNWGYLTDKVKKIADSLPKLNEYVDINKLLGKGQGLYNLIPKDVIICLDDLERVVDKIDINEVLGTINELVENIEYKVIVIANEGFINKNQLIFKEKVVEKTIVFVPETLKIFEEIVCSYENEDYTKYMCKEAVNLILPENKLVAKSDLYKKHISNIRILKFAIEHFYTVFLYYQNNHDLGDSKVQLKLKNYWAFILAVSIEYKLNNLSFEDKRTLDSYVHNSIANFDIDMDGSSQQVSFDKEIDEKISDEEQEKKSCSDSAFQKRFYEKYFTIQDEYPIYHNELYSFITGGITPDYDKLDSEMEKALTEFISSGNPAYELLSLFMNGIWGFSNSEIDYKLQQLFSYVKQGDFNDYVSYLNASFFLLNYRELLSISEEDIKVGIIEGIDKLSDKIPTGYLLKSNLQMIRMDISESVVWIYNYIMDKITQKEDEEEKEEIIRLNQKIGVDLKSFVTDCMCIPYGPTPKYFNRPILNHIEEKNITEIVSNAEPHDIYLLVNLLSERYEKGLSETAKEELPFVEKLKDTILNTDLTSKKLSNKLIEIYLMPKVDSILRRYSK